MPERQKHTIVIAGATGFVGQALVRALSRDHRVIGLTRSPERAAQSPGVEWRACDLFSWRSLDRALAGADTAIYLVHSMLPAHPGTSARFEDLDLLLADNFARAAERAGIRQLLYLGGLTPPGDSLSPHLASRLEVERTLGSRAVPLTALRAGLIVGPGGSSLAVLVNLVRRLPAMILPRWTESRTQPIALRDVVRAFALSVGDPTKAGKAFDIGGPDVLTYREMMARTGDVIGRRPWMIGVPLFSPRLSRLWVSLIGGASGALVGPLVESLRHDMVVQPNPLQALLEPDAQGFESALGEALDNEGATRTDPRFRIAPLRARRGAKPTRARSLQRLLLPRGRDARWAADEYLRFLPRFGSPLLHCEVDGVRVRFFLRGTRLRLLEMHFAPERSASDRQIFDVIGGLLVRNEPGLLGRLEIRQVLGGGEALAAVHDFKPALPWTLYAQTHARVHDWVMRGFARHLSRLAAHPVETGGESRGQSPQSCAQRTSAQSSSSSLIR